MGIQGHRNARRGCPQVLAWVVFPVAVVAAASGPARALQINQLSTLGEEVRDGRVEDIAGPVFVTNSSESRIWLAQGRVRVALHASDHERMFDEDTTFQDSDHADDYERILALEVDDLNDRLYTLTERALYREDISDPTQPTSKVVLDFYPTSGALLQDWESFQDMKLWSPENRIFVMTQKRIIIVEDTGSGLALGAWTDDMFYPTGNPASTNTTPLPTETCPDPNPRGIGAVEARFLRRLRVIEDENDEVMAWVTVDAHAYPSSGRPSPQVVVACSLSNGNWSDPTFDCDPSSDVNYVYWNPFPEAPGTFDDPVQNFTAYGLDAFAIDDERYLYVACGKENQVQRFTITNAFPQSCSVELVPDLTETLDTDNHIYNVLSDRYGGFRFFAVSPTGFFIRDPVPDELSVTFNEAFGKGCPRDLIHVSFSWSEPQQETVWTAVQGDADHICKEFDVTTNEVGLVAEFYSLYASDGGVALFDGTDTHVYIPTWSGVVRYEQVSSQPAWRAVPESYQPAEVDQTPSNDWKVFPTEHIETGKVNEVDRLFTVSANGGFMEFPINSTSHNPNLGAAFYPVPELLPSGWSSTGVWGNDVHFLDLSPSHPTDSKFLLLDMAKLTPADPGYDTQVVGLLAYQWHAPTNRWVHRASAFASATTQASSIILTDTITIAQANNKVFAFVAHDRGFLTVDLTGLTDSTPAMSVVEEVCVASAPNFCLPCQALTVSGDRLFIYVNDSTRFIRVYQWDQSTGELLGQVGSDLPQSAFPQPLDAGPGLGYRARFDVINSSTGEGDMYIAAAPYLLQLRWTPQTLTTPEDLSFTGYWKSDYTQPLQDCRIYTLQSLQGSPKGILTVKDSESFGFVGP
jgi:hypothetical protein